MNERPPRVFALLHGRAFGVVDATRSPQVVAELGVLQVEALERGNFVFDT